MLWRHVRGSPQQVRGLGESPGFGDLRDAEVEELDYLLSTPAAREEDVLRLQIALPMRTNES
jgi:hypothetical protein